MNKKTNSDAAPENTGEKRKKSSRETRQTKELRQRVEALTSDLQRERADFANYKRRNEADRAQLSVFAKMEVITQLLPMIDDLERALSHLPDELKGNSWAEGVKKVYDQVQQKLQNLNVNRIESEGATFDPELHEAVEFSDGEGDNEVVTEELQAGYMMDGAVLRPAIVKVGKPGAIDNNDKEPVNQVKQDK